MGTPAPGQLEGTAGERLSELACRICYDSLGVNPATGRPRGRSSPALHRHVQEVNHGSVYEHYHETVELPVNDDLVYRTLANRQGIWVESAIGRAQITANLRAVLEWDRWTNHTNCTQLTGPIGYVLSGHFHRLAPQVLKPPHAQDSRAEQLYASSRRLEPAELREHQAWISLYLSGSRGWSHEQVRHGDETAISQRSTRYVDESDSPYTRHPLVQAFLADPAVDPDLRTALDLKISTSEAADKHTYRALVHALQDYLVGRVPGLDKTTARKQARGAARGYLGNALHTEMVFSASAAQWCWMLQQRGCQAADAEIRALYAGGHESSVLGALRRSRYHHFFDRFGLADAEDGLGQVLAKAPSK